MNAARSYRIHLLRSAFVLFSALVALGCSGSDTAVYAERSEPGSGEGGGEAVAGEAQVLAVVGGSEITRDEVGEAVAAEILKAERQKHEALERGLDQLVADKLLELEAAEQGLTPEDLLQKEVESKIEPPTDEVVDAFYEARKSQIRQPKEQVVDQIRAFLSQQQATEGRQAFLERLKAEHGYEVFLEPFRVPMKTEGFPARGPADAPVTVVEFSDFECPYCSRVVPTLERVQEEYGNKVRVVFRQFPLSRIHPNAQKAAEASLCAHDQGKFWELHDAMFEQQRKLGVEDLKARAAELGLEAETFNTCLDSGRHAEAVQADLQAGTVAGVSGTPALFINGRFLAGAQPYEEIAEVIDAELGRSGS